MGRKLQEEVEKLEMRMGKREALSGRPFLETQISLIVAEILANGKTNCCALTTGGVLLLPTVH